MIGTWDVTGEEKGIRGARGEPFSSQISGVSTLHWALGGPVLVHEFERSAAGDPVVGLDVHRASADETSMRAWWFDDGGQIDPITVDGPMTDASWRGKGTLPNGIPIGSDWTKKGEGLEVRYESDGVLASSETYTRKK